MAKYTFFTQAARDSANYQNSSEELVNCFAEEAPGDGVSRVTVRQVPGEVSFSDLPTALPQASVIVNNKAYIAAVGVLYEIQSNGTSAAVGNIGNGDTSMSRNNGYVTIAADGGYYVYDGSSISQPSGGAFTSVGSVTFHNQRTILTEEGGSKFEWTDLADPTSRRALNFSTAEKRPDTILRVLPDRNHIYIFKTESIEVWRDTGNAGSTAYAPLVGGVIDQGLKAYDLITRWDSGIAFIGNDDVVYSFDGTTAPREISTPAVNSDLKDRTPTRLFYSEWRGHKFLHVRFSDAMTWSYDFKTTLWHRRSSGVNFGPWTTVDTFNAWGNWYAITEATEVYQMTGTTDADAALRRVMRGKPVYMAGTKFSVSAFEFLCEKGVSDLGRDAEAMFRCSWDGGRTWTLEETASIGDLGDYSQRAIFRGLGRGEIFTPEVAIADDAEIAMYSDANVRYG